MFEEREDPEVYTGGKNNLDETPYIVNLHNGSPKKSPFEWIKSKIFYKQN